MQGDPRSQRCFCITLQARKLARPPSRENLQNERSDDAGDHTSAAISCSQQHPPGSQTRSSFFKGGPEEP